MQVNQAVVAEIIQRLMQAEQRLEEIKVRLATYDAQRQALQTLAEQANRQR